MEVHIFLLSTMNAADTAVNLESLSITFDCQEGTIQKFKCPCTHSPVSISLWVACMHPLVEHLAASVVPHMDAVVCWYHDHDGLSCLQVEQAMGLLQPLHNNVRLMATTAPPKREVHHSRIRKYYDEHGFAIERLTETMDKNIEEILRVHLDIQKNL